MHIFHHFLGWFLPAWFSVALHGDLGFPGMSDGKESACNAGDTSLIPGSGRSSGEGNNYPLQYSCLENSVNRGAWWATIHGIMRSQIRLRYRTWGNTHGVLSKTVAFLTLPPVNGHILLPRKCSNRFKFLDYTSHTWKGYDLIEQWNVLLKVNYGTSFESAHCKVWVPPA